MYHNREDRLHPGSPTQTSRSSFHLFSAYLRGLLSLTIFTLTANGSQFAYNFAGGGQTLNITNGRELAIAFSDADVACIRVMNDITMNDVDYDGLGNLPLILDRNVTLLGAFPGNQAINAYIPVLDFNYIQGKLRLAKDIWLVFDGVVLTNYRETLPSSSPGTDLLTDTAPNSTAYVLLQRAAINNRLCFPANISRESVNKTVRPRFLDGQQNVTSDLEQPGCIQSSISAPWLQRCWAVRRHYFDVASMGYVIDLMTDRQRKTNYYVLVIDTPLLCDDVMTYDCYYKMGGALGCFRAATSRKPPSPLPLLPPPNEGGSGEGDIALIVGLSVGIGGGLLMIAAAAYMVVAHGRGKLRGSATQRSFTNDIEDDVKLGTLAANEEVAGQQLQREQWRSWRFCARCCCVLGRFIDGGGSQDGAEVAGIFEAAYLSGRNGTDGQQEDASVINRTKCMNFADIAELSMQVPVTTLTPIRPDVKLLIPYRDENEVMVMPHKLRGKGAFGRVIEGSYQGQKVAVKLVLDVNQLDGSATETVVRSFVQEVEVLGRCQHPNVVRLLAACLTPPRLCLVEELMETSLERLLYERPKKLVPLRKVLHIAIEICKGLEYLHPTVVHRDLKPDNVLLNNPHEDHPVVKITDFGLSRLRSTTMPTLTPDAGTPAYLSPEGFDLANDVITHHADMYSLAVMIWEMLAGEKPWQGCTLVEVAHKVTIQGARLPLRGIPDTRCPQGLKALIRECWDADPRRRPAAAEAGKRLALMQEVLDSSGEAEGAATATDPSANPVGPQGTNIYPRALLPWASARGYSGCTAWLHNAKPCKEGSVDVSEDLVPPDTATPPAGTALAIHPLQIGRFFRKAAGGNIAASDPPPAGARSSGTQSSLQPLHANDGARMKRQDKEEAGGTQQSKQAHRRRCLPVIQQPSAGGQSGAAAVDLGRALVTSTTHTGRGSNSYPMCRACTLTFLSLGSLVAMGNEVSESRHAASTAGGGAAAVMSSAAVVTSKGSRAGSFGILRDPSGSADVAQDAKDEEEEAACAATPIAEDASSAEDAPAGAA